ncbi:MAG: ExbD/TolR family protein [Alphaproteobacteria bacterium]
MSRRRKRRSETGGINLTPVLGLAFILLLFVVAAFPFAQERGIDFLNVESGGICDCGDPIVITVDSRNRIFVGVGEARKQVTLRAVETHVARLLAENPQSAVLVQAHKQSDMGVVIRAVDQARQARDAPPVPVQIATVEGPDDPKAEKTR